LIWSVNRKKGEGIEGRVAGTYLIGYGLARFFLESLRPEEMVWQIGEMAVAQVASILAIMLGVRLFCWKR